MKDLKVEKFEFESLRDFLTELKRKLGEKYNKSTKVAELKWVKQIQRLSINQRIQVRNKQGYKTKTYKDKKLSTKYKSMI